jgi:hypothetical protein
LGCRCSLTVARFIYSPCYSICLLDGLYNGPSDVRTIGSFPIWAFSTHGPATGKELVGRANLRDCRIGSSGRDTGDTTYTAEGSPSFQDPANHAGGSSLFSVSSTSASSSPSPPASNPTAAETLIRAHRHWRTRTEAAAAVGGGPTGGPRGGVSLPAPATRANGGAGPREGTPVARRGSAQVRTAHPL